MRLLSGASLLIAAAILAYPTVSLAEIVKLKNGTVLRGSIVQMTETELTIETADMGQVQVKRRAVQSFEDDSATPAAAAPAPTPAAPAAAPAAAPVGISINNNNNNNNTASTAATAAAVTTPPQEAPKPAAPPPDPLAPSTGIVFGAIEAGMTYAKRTYGYSTSEDASNWTKPTPTVHWDLVGYHWENGLGVMVFGDATKEQQTGDVAWQWLQAGLRFDAAFGHHETRFGMGEFYAGLGAAHSVMTMKASVTNWYPHLASWGEDGTDPRQSQLSVTQEGTAAVVRLGYRALSTAGLGVDLGVELAQAWLGTGTIDSGDAPGPDGVASKAILQTAGLTLGVAYAL